MVIENDVLFHVPEQKKKEKKTECLMLLQLGLVTRGILDTKKGVYEGGVMMTRSDGHMTLTGHMTYHPIGD